MSGASFASQTGWELKCHRPKGESGGLLGVHKAFEVSLVMDTYILR